LLIDPRVIASERANSDDGNVNQVISGQVPLAAADCRKVLI